MSLPLPDNCIVITEKLDRWPWEREVVQCGVAHMQAMNQMLWWLGVTVALLLSFAALKYTWRGARWCWVTLFLIRPKYFSLKQFHEERCRLEREKLNAYHQRLGLTGTPDDWVVRNGDIVRAIHPENEEVAS